MVIVSSFWAQKNREGRGEGKPKVLLSDLDAMISFKG
jgi:hypothetical protein